MSGRAHTIHPVHRLTRAEIHSAALTIYPDIERPRTRGQCWPHPCPFVSCRHHLYLDVDERTGAIKLNFPHLEPAELEQTCSLDVADLGDHTLDQVGDFLNVARERVRQLEVVAMGEAKETVLAWELLERRERKAG